MQRISAGVTAWHQMYAEDICRSDCMASNACSISAGVTTWHQVSAEDIYRSDCMASNACRVYLQE